MTDQESGVHGTAGERPASDACGRSLFGRWMPWLFTGWFVVLSVVAAEVSVRGLALSVASLVETFVHSPSLWTLCFGFALSGFVAVAHGRKRAALTARVFELERDAQGAKEECAAAKAEADLQRKELRRFMELHEIAVRRFEELFQGLPVACFTYDREGTVFECNRETERMYGLPAHLVQHSKVLDTLWKGTPSDRLTEIVESVFGGEAVHNVELAFTRADGKPLCSLVSTFPLVGHDGKITGAICATVDITQRKALEKRIEEQVAQLNALNADLQKKERKLEVANKRLRQLAETDPLTGVANRRAFRMKLDVEIEKARAENLSLSLLLLDVDHFKRFNDTFGHQAGDKVLTQVAHILRDEVRMEDIVARFGGEEFVVLLPCTAPNQALGAAERLRQAIESAPWEFGPVTASFGVSTSAGDNLDARTLLEQADSAMYASKKAGRNRVTHFWSVAPDAPKRDAA